MPCSISRRTFLKISTAALPALIFKPPRRHPSPPIASPYRPSGLLGRSLMIWITIYSRPSVFGRQVARYDKDELVPLYETITGEDHNSQPDDWFRTDGGYVYHTNIQPVTVALNPPPSAAPEGGQLIEITVPYVDAFSRPAFRGLPRYRLYYSSTHWVTDVVFDQDRRPWYSLEDDRINETYYVRAEYARPVPRGELTPLSPHIPADQKRIELVTSTMWMYAYEGDTLVRQARIAAGTVFKAPSGKVSDYRTPLGEYAVHMKRASRHMAGGDLAAADEFDLPGVPWVSYFNEGIALHGTYWHNIYGTAQSHGCINLEPEVSKWAFRWTLPAPIADQRETEARGTRVLVR